MTPVLMSSNSFSMPHRRFTCARLSHSYLTWSMPRLLTMTFTTAVFGRSSSWRFEAFPCRTAPKGPPSSLEQHDAPGRLLDTTPPSCRSYSAHNKKAASRAAFFYSLAGCSWDLHPLESAAFARRTPKGGIPASCVTLPPRAHLQRLPTTASPWTSACACCKFRYLS